jgi:DNA-directed RNA polymerase
MRVGGSASTDAINSAREMPVLYGALNALQNTPWTINRHVFSLLTQLSDLHLSIANLPTGEREPLPKKPDDIDTNEQSRKDWRRAAHQVKERNHLADNRALEFQRVMATATRLKDYDAFFFPHNLDFRGRIYPVSHYLTPQGDDLQKGLLTFAQGKPLGRDGATYLALHGMSCLDETPEGQKVKRMTLDERMKWVVDHGAEICAVANDPLGYRWWAEADEPLQFFAFCVEWNGFMQLAKEGRGDEYVCALPVSIDGSCNGLQHFSAMLRDEAGAKAVNVYPNARPEDVYDRISDAVKDRLEQLWITQTEGHILAAMWLASGMVDRALMKRPTMTFSYGSKQYGFQQQLMDYLHDAKRWPLVGRKFELDGKDHLPAACALLAKLIWQSLQEVVVAAFDGMEWMQQAARIIARNAQPIEWDVPLIGFHVRQEYYVTQLRQITTVLAGRVVRPAISEATKEIQLHKQANAVSPNVIHSLDAAGLMLSVTDAQAEGVEHFAAVHDSYGTLAADMGVLWRCARQSFVRLYVSHNIIADIAEQFQKQAPEGEQLPPPPAMGNLDVAAVVASDYFFC